MQVFGEDQSETDIKSKSGGSRFWHLSQDNCLNFNSPPTLTITDLQALLCILRPRTVNADASQNLRHTSY